MRKDRLIARLGLAAALAVMSLCLLILSRQALTANSPTAEIGKTAPQFTLPSLAGPPVSLSSLQGRPVLLFFGSDTCPVSKHYSEQLLTLAREYSKNHQIAFLAINSNTLAHSPDPETLALVPSPKEIPTLLDPLAQVAAAYGVTATPTFCLIDSSGILQYSGSFDNGPATKSGPTHTYLADALLHTLSGTPLDISSTQAFGQTITWVR